MLARSRLLLGLVALVVVVWPAVASAAAIDPVAVDHGLFGAFKANGTALEGSFVYFKVNATTRHLILFSVGATKKDVVFDDVNVTPVRAAGTPDLFGPDYRLPSQDLLLSAHDTPRAPLSYKAAADPLQVTFHAARGVLLKASGNPSIVNVTFGHNEGWIVANGGSIALSGSNANVDLRPNGRVTFHMLPRASLWETRARDVEEAFSRQDVAAETVVANDNGVLVQDTVSYGATVRVTRTNATMADLNVTSPFKGGKSFVVHFDNTTLRPGPRFTLLVNGTPALPSSVLGALLPGSAPRFAVVESTRGVSLFVSVPSAEQFQLTLLGPDAPPPPTSNPPAATPPATGTATPPQPIPGVGVLWVVGALAAVAVWTTFDDRPKRFN